MTRRQRRHRAGFAVERMRHHRGVDAFEHALVEQNDFAAAAFLGGRPEKHDFSRQILRAILEAYDGRQRCACDQIVAAGVAVGQRVVLGEDRDRGSAAISKLGAKRGRKAAHGGFHWESQLARGAAQQSGGEMFLEFRFGFFVNLMAE